MNEVVRESPVVTQPVRRDGAVVLGRPRLADVTARPTVPVEVVERTAEAAMAVARERGRAEGLAEGRAAGQAQGLAEVETLLHQANDLVAGIQQTRAQLLIDERAEIIASVLAVAEELVGEALERDPRMIERIVSKVLADVERERELVIEMAPPQRALLIELWERDAPEPYRKGRWRIEASPDLGPRDVRIRFANGYLDGRLSVRLEQIRRTLLAAAVIED